MIASLASVLGVSAQDPSFWMPLALMGLLFAIIVAGTVLGGFDIGVGCLTLFAPHELRARMMSLLGPLSDANEFLLFLGMGLFAAAFPGAWGATMRKTYLQLFLLWFGVVLASFLFVLLIA